jgi:hypothetical protein
MTVGVCERSIHHKHSAINQEVLKMREIRNNTEKTNQTPGRSDQEA